VIRGSSSWYQTSHDTLRQMLRNVLADGAQAGQGAAAGIESVEGRAVVTLYSLLRDHRWISGDGVGPAAASPSAASEPAPPVIPADSGCPAPASPQSGTAGLESRRDRG
jgi:hypothetical protein